MSISVNIFNLEEVETMLARDKGNFHAPGENRTRDGPGFILPSTIDDWTVLKITEKIIQRNVFFFKQKEKETRVKRWSSFEQLRPVEHLLRQ